MPATGSLFLLAGDRLGRTLAGTGIGMSPLATHRQRAAMAQTAIVAEVHEPLDVHGNLPTQIALDAIVAVDGLADLQDLRIGQLIDTPLIRDAALLHDLVGESRADAVDVLQRNHHALVGRQVDASYTGHTSLLDLNLPLPMKVSPECATALPSVHPSTTERKRQHCKRISP